MKKYLLSILIVGFISISLSYGQLSPGEKGLQSITLNAIKAQLGFLASDWTEGRAAGEKGEYLSSDYIASLLQLYGVNPGGDVLQVRSRVDNTSSNEKTYFQNFYLLKTTTGTEQVLKAKTIEGSTIKTNSFAYGVDYFSRPSSNDIEIEAPIVFVGFGFKNDKIRVNDFSKLDIKGKFLLKISGTPEFSHELLTPVELSASEREIEILARAEGAAGIIEFNPNATGVGIPIRNDFNNLSPNENNQRSQLSGISFSIPGKKNPDNLRRISVSVKTANEILKGTGIEIDDYIKNANTNTPYTILQKAVKSIYFKSTVNSTSVAVRNVIGIIEGNNPNEVIVIGAHYDHMGMNNGFVWNGADDNGSGTVGALTIAKAIMDSGKKPEKTIIIALWTAEEEGLLGSRYWVQNPTCPIKNVKLNVNFDMISRYITDSEPKKVTMTYTNSCTGFKDLTVTNLKKYGIDLIVDYQPSADPPGGTDHRSFVAVGIPIMRFKPGHREEYHTPGDELETINWDIMEKIIKISFANIWELANTSW
jgi:hypothetical protein